MRMIVRNSYAEKRMMSMPDGLTVSQVEHSYEGKKVLHGVDFAVPDGRVVALLGPSGCGKSTILRTIAGLIVPDRGAITLDGRDITRVPVRDRRLGMVFQNFALFSHMTVAENIAYGLNALTRQIGTPEEIYDRAASLFVNGFIGHANQFPATATGETELTAADGTVIALPRKLNFFPGSPIVVTARPEHLTVSDAPGPGAFAARFDRAVIQGSLLSIEASLPTGTPIRAQVPRENARPSRGDTIFLRADPARVHVFPAPAPAIA